MYSFDEHMGEHPSTPTPTHIATYLLPPTLSTIVPGISLWGPKNGAYNKADQRPFKTAEGASIFSVGYANYNLITS